MAKQPKTLPDDASKNPRVKLRDLPARKGTEGGAAKSLAPAKGSQSSVPKSLEEFLRRESLRID